MSEVTEITIPDNAPAIVNFLKTDHELAAVLKSLDKASKAAVKFLEGVLTDEKADGLRKQQAAEKILTFYLQASKQMNDDDMARLIAQAKLGNGKGRSVGLTGGERPEAPALDFDTVRKV